MPAYTLDMGGTTVDIKAKDAADARGKAAKLMAGEGCRRAELAGPNGNVWEIFYEGFGLGKSGWMYSDGKATESVFPKQTPKAGTLLVDEWQGIYELDNGMFLMADESQDYLHEDFATVGAINYQIYDEEGEFEGGWYGYDEDTKWGDFKKFVALDNGPRIGRRIKKGTDDDFYDIVDLLEEGVTAEELYEECGVKPKEKVPPKKKAPVKKPADKPKGTAQKKKAPAKTTSGKSTDAVQDARSNHSKALDSKKKAKNTFPADYTDEQYDRWAAHPGRYDIQGIDTPSIRRGSSGSVRGRSAPRQRRPVPRRRF